jgi:hypothetical protein
MTYFQAVSNAPSPPRKLSALNDLDLLSPRPHLDGLNLFFPSSSRLLPFRSCPSFFPSVPPLEPRLDFVVRYSSRCSKLEGGSKAMLPPTRRVSTLSMNWPKVSLTTEIVPHLLRTSSSRCHERYVNFHPAGHSGAILMSNGYSCHLYHER